MNVLISTLLEQYGYSVSPALVTLRETDYNAVYRIDRGDSDSRILRVSKRLNSVDVDFELDALDYYAQHTSLLPKIYRTTTGSRFAQVDETVGVLFSYIDGRHVLVDATHLPDPSQVFAAGQSLGVFHSIGLNFSTQASRSRTLTTELEGLLHDAELFCERYEQGETFLCEVQDNIAFAQSNKGMRGLVHNDYRPHNVFFSYQGEVNGIIDLDWSCRGQIVKDVAHGALEWSFPDGRDEPDKILFEAFLSGYNEAGPEKIDINDTLYRWVMFGALADTATYLHNQLSELPNEKSRIRSYMYKKYRYYKSLLD